MTMHGSISVKVSQLPKIAQKGGENARPSRRRVLSRNFKAMLRTLLLMVLLATPAAAQNLDSLLARMTLEEKLGQLNLLSADGRASPQQLQLVRAGKLGGLFNVIGAENTTPVQRIAVTESRLKIQLLFGLDVIHGYRTIFPIPLGEASAFDPDAAEATARAAGQEAAAFGINWTYAPMVDIARDPRWGRIAEGSGEIPISARSWAPRGCAVFSRTFSRPRNTSPA